MTCATGAGPKSRSPRPTSRVSVLRNRMEWARHKFPSYGFMGTSSVVFHPCSYTSGLASRSPRPMTAPAHRAGRRRDSADGWDVLRGKSGLLRGSIVGLLCSRVRQREIPRIVSCLCNARMSTRAGVTCRDSRGLRTTGLAGRGEPSPRSVSAAHPQPMRPKSAKPDRHRSADHQGGRRRRRGPGRCRFTQ